MPETLQQLQASLTAAATINRRLLLITARQEAAPKALQYARNAVPKDRPLTVNTIKTKAFQKGDEVNIEIKAKGAALFLEFGTVKMAPKPFMFTALRKVQHPYARRMADIGEAVLSGKRY